MFSTEFRFGLEAEYVVAKTATFEPLWHDTVSFTTLNRCLERVEIRDLPSSADLRLEAPHRKRMPFVVEGYHVPEAGSHAIDILPKGVEIRTPVCRSVDRTLDVLQILFERMQSSLREEGLTAVAISHHPTATRFEAPQGNRRHDLWLWAKEAMTTYGPDVNVSFPHEIASRIDHDDLLAKINHYGPAMTAFSLASPFFEGKLWTHRGRVGKACRTFRRSIIAPPLEVHPQENGRIEFKVFEMSTNLQDYRNYFLLFLALVLDDQLAGRASAASRIYDLGNVARDGFADDEIRFRADEILESCYRVLPRWGFDPAPLESFCSRLRNQVTPADEMIELYQERGSLTEVLRERAQLISPATATLEAVSQ